MNYVEHKMFRTSSLPASIEAEAAVFRTITGAVYLIRRYDTVTCGSTAVQLQIMNTEVFEIQISV